MKIMIKKYHRSKFYWFWHTVLLWFGSSLGFLIIASVNVGLYIDAWETAFIAAAVVGILNSLFWPLLSRVLLPFMILTVGIGAYG